MGRAVLCALVLASFARGASGAPTETPTAAAWQGKDRATEVAIYPNPCAKIEATVSFSVAADAEAKVLLFDEAGAVMTEIPVAATAGVNNVPLDLRRASPGVYYLRVHVRWSADRVDLLPRDKPAKFLIVR